MNIELIYKTYKNQLKAFLHTNINSPADVDDLLQEILLKSYQNLHTIKDNSSISAWLFQIARRTIIDFYRQKGRGRQLDGDELWYQQEQPDAHSQLAQCLSPFIQSLPLKDAELLTQIEINGLAQKSYAEQHQLNYSTVKSRVKKAREQLHKRFSDCCELSVDVRGNISDFTPKSGHCKNG
ncbi:RNA polymerase sigma factor SigZ [Thalassomonas haliotis]|uniref:RNA polymerase sigma factor SigZ n=1 Tax=Thalassomonas haliotis TaxID=485448 RepID=A0ABY7VJV6_9GAMM|nr:RNA polymerase sigma factor SigZ [Thalassomonas haliotis]WDE13798.1 RNA polymerase sigma factor SigZ [Thalassomonas haliotis]